MRTKKVVHNCFVVLISLSETLAVVCLVLGLLKLFSENASRVLHVVEWGFIFIWLILVLAVKVVLKVKFLRAKTPGDWVFSIVPPLGFITWLTGYFVWKGNSQLLHSFVFQIAGYISLYFDLAFVKPLLKRTEAEGGEGQNLN